MIDPEVIAIANAHGVELCDHCGEPEALHVAYDHKRNRCMLAYKGWGIHWLWKSSAEKADMIKRINAFYAEWDQLEESRRQLGAGI